MSNSQNLHARRGQRVSGKQMRFDKLILTAFSFTRIPGLQARFLRRQVRLASNRLVSTSLVENTLYACVKAQLRNKTPD